MELASGVGKLQKERMLFAKDSKKNSYRKPNNKKKKHILAKTFLW